MGSAFVELLGPQLTSQGGGVVKTADALTNKVVGLYFSAHWCGPCRGFTPELAKKYNELKAQGKEFEIVFVSSDRDEDAFKEYHSEQPWLALPFAERDVKAKLSKKYKVRGIPTLVILNEEAEVITKDGRSAVADLAKFPWKPPTLAECLGTEFLSKDGSVVTLESLKGKYLGLYFSAHWCPPCKRFTPELVKTYHKLQEAGKAFEIIFVSSDQSKEQFAEYWGEMPWLALDYSKREQKENLSSHFEVSGIPTFIMLDPELNVINAEARGSVSSDPSGAEFPWMPKLVKDLDDVDESIEDTPSVVAFMEEAGGAWDDTEAALLSAAEKENQAEPGVKFWTAKEVGGVSSQVRKLCGLPAKPKVDDVTLVLLDLADNGSYYTAGAEASVDQFVADFKAGALQKQQVKK